MGLAVRTFRNRPLLGCACIWILTILASGCAPKFNFTPSALDALAPVVNSLTISNLSVQQQSPMGFSASLDFSGDSNGSASVKLYYCDNTASPSCNPLNGTSVAMTRGTSTYTASVSGLTSPYTAGDSMKVEVSATDSDGVTGSPLSGTTTLPAMGSILSQIVNWAGSGDLTTKSASITSWNAQTAGNTNLVFLNYNNPTTYVKTIVDSAGNTYAKINPTTPQTNVDVYYATNIAAAAADTNTLTVTLNQVDPGWEIEMIEVEGLGAIDNAVEDSGGSSTYTESITTTQPYDAVFCFLESGGFATTMNNFEMGWQTGNGNLWGALDAPTTGTYTCSGNTSSGATTEMVAFRNSGPVKPFKLIQPLGGEDGIASPVITFKSPQISGDMNVVSVAWDTSTVAISGGITDSSGNAYSLAAGPVSYNSLQIAIYYAPNIASAGAGANSITVHFSGSTNSEIQAFEYQGVTALDMGSSNSGTSASANSGSVTTSFANEIVFTAFFNEFTGANSPDPGFRMMFPGTSHNDNPSQDFPADQYVSSTGTYSNSFNLIGGTQDWVGAIAAFH